MRFNRLVAVLFTTLAALAHGDDGASRQSEEARRCLGEQFVESLKDDNIVSYAQCWLSAQIIFTAACNDPKCGKFELEGMRRQLPARDLRIARQFEFLRDRLKELTGDMSSLKLESVRVDPRVLLEGNSDAAGQVPPDDTVTVVARVDPDTTVEIMINGVKGIGDSWRFTRSPDLRSVLNVTAPR